MSAANDREQRQTIIDACRRMNALGIHQGTPGNISLRHPDGMPAAPTSVPYSTDPHMIAAAGDDSLRCAPHATFGTNELSQYAAKALEDRLACLLAHHPTTSRFNTPTS